MSKILKRHQQLENGKMYSSEVVFAGKIFKFIDENANTFRFFAYLAEWADCYPIYMGILPRLSSIIKSYYYNKGELEHWEYLKGLNFRDVRVNMI